MAMTLDDECSPADLRKFESTYKLEMTKAEPTGKTQFEYAFCLVRTTNKTNLQMALNLFENLYNKRAKTEDEKRDYLYYIIIAQAKLKEYELALNNADSILKVQPSNNQVKELKDEIKKRMKRDGLIGVAVAGGAIAAGVAGVATLVGLAISRATK